MARSLSSAHYQHAKAGLSLMLKPPVRNATAMVWASRGRLVVGTADGGGHQVHPAMGTTSLWSDRSAVLGLGVHGGQLVVVEEGGTWRLLDEDCCEVYAAEHPFVGPVTVQFDVNRVLLTGRTAQEPRTLFYENGKKVFRIRLPDHCVALIDDDTEMALAQATETGLEVIRVAPGARFSRQNSEEYRLSVVSGGVVGMNDHSVRLWRTGDWTSVDVSMAEASVAAMSGDGRYLAIGTTSGGVAMIDLEDASAIADPPIVGVSSEEVRSLSFSHRGRWLASGADVLAVWSWEAAR